MSNTTQYKLVYFNLRTLGEPIRMLFKYMQIQFEDVRIDPAEWQGQVRTSEKFLIQFASVYNIRDLIHVIN